MKQKSILYAIVLLGCGIYLLMPEPKSVDNGWSGRRGPSTGTACLKEAPGPSLTLAWTLDLLDPNGDGASDDNMGHPADDVFRSGTQVRGDASKIYLRIARDYAPVAPSTLYMLDPQTGDILWASDKAMSQDITCPRAFQLYKSPHGFTALNVPAFYNSHWDTLDTETLSTLKQFFHSHSNIGSRAISEKWAWKNSRMIPDYQITYHHGGQLLFWKNGAYSPFGEEDLCLLDHAWDQTKAVIFVLSGFTPDRFAPYKNARYMVLDPRGFISHDSVVEDIYRPLCPRSWTTVNTDIVMGMALAGDVLYAMERSTDKDTSLVRRRINDNFAKEASVFLGSSPKVRAFSFCIDDQALYLHTQNSIRIYTLDLQTLIREIPVPPRSLYHSSAQTFDFKTFPANRNYPQQTIACDGTYLYHSCDDRFQVRKAIDGELCFEHIFSDLPNKRKTPSGRSIKGIAGDVIILPGHVLIASAMDASKIWAFKKSKP